MKNMKWREWNNEEMIMKSNEIINEIIMKMNER